jgi:hypothetical protein
VLAQEKNMFAAIWHTLVGALVLVVGTGVLIVVIRFLGEILLASVFIYLAWTIGKALFSG